MADYWNSAAQTHRGKCRERNEDAVLSQPRSGLWMVADGMGGHAHGEYASQSICDALVQLPNTPELSARVDLVEDALLSVNDGLRAHAREHCQGATIGSTVVAMLADATVGVVLWAGDSRLYRLRNGRLEQITRDHNPAFELYESGGISEAELLGSESNIITRAVGSQYALNLDIAVFDVIPGDTYLLCSDGLYRELEADEVREQLGGQSPDRVARELLRSCLRSPARDNLSLVVVRAGSAP